MLPEVGPEEGKTPVGLGEFVVLITETVPFLLEMYASEPSGERDVVVQWELERAVTRFVVVSMTVSPASLVVCL